MNAKKNAEKSIWENDVSDIVGKMCDDAANKNGLTFEEIKKYCIAILDAEIRRNDIIMAKCRKILGKETK